MAIPDYQSIMLPLLEQISDNKEWVFRNVVEELAKKYSLTDNERKELLPSGQQPIFDNRVGWARTYLKKAGLIDAPKRGLLKISPKGLEILQRKPERINVKYLQQFPEFLEFQSLKRDESSTEEKVVEQEEQTPEESLDYSYQKIRKALALELLNKVMSLTPTFFEKLVVELLVKMGYGGSIKDAGKAIGRSGDEGIDGTIKEDKLGLDVIYIQAKRWQPGNVVGRPELQKFVGALAGQGAKKGIFITTSNFTKEALDYSQKMKQRLF